MPKSQRNKPNGLRVSRKLLKRWPLPEPDSDDDKEGRGRVLVVGGEVSLPGALVLAGIAALRAGAGKLQIATCESIARDVGVAVPESLSLGLAETAEGTLSPSEAASLAPYTSRVDALLIGPGMKDGDNNDSFVVQLLKQPRNAPVILDAGALRCLRDDNEALHHCEGAAVLTPHAGEMATILGAERADVVADPSGMALRAAESLRAVIALKGSRTFIASPEGDLFRYEGGDIGLATSGSGDTLAGVIAGLLARGASPISATLWGVHLHGAAGNRLAKRIGRIGYLARELLDEIPPIMNRL